MKTVTRSSNAPGFREAFASLPKGSPLAAVWGRFLDLAPAGYAEFWVAYEEETPVGRIGANRVISTPGTGSIGFFEVDGDRPEVARALLAAAEGWLRAQGLSEAVGPMNLNTWFPYRLRVDDSPERFAWEPNNPPLYPKWWEAGGYTPVEQYHTTGSGGLAGYADKTKAVYEEAVRSGFTFRSFDGENFLEKEIPVLYELSMAGFSSNFLFEPITLQQFRELYVPIVKRMDFSCAFYAVSPEDKEVGFLFAFPESDFLVLKSATVIDDYRGKGLSTALTHLAARAGVERGLGNFISALVRTGNRSESYAKKGHTLWEHHYVLYSKKL